MVDGALLHFEPLKLLNCQCLESTLPAIGLPLPGPESRTQLWNKAKLTFSYIYDHHLNDYDWFFKADEDT
jgi:hypothetical protein